MSFPPDAGQESSRRQSSRAMEKEKILQVMEKYRDYFNEWNADVAFGVHRKNIFYVPASDDEFETFLFSRRRISLKRSYWVRLQKILRSLWRLV